VRDLIPESDAAILLRDHGWVTFVAMVTRVWPVIALLAALVVGSILQASSASPAWGRVPIRGLARAPSRCATEIPGHV
jgi:hypothetical protein